MPPSIPVTDTASPDKPRGGKRVVHILMHILHLLIALLILVIAILELIFCSSHSLSVLYLIPFAIYEIVYTLHRLFDKSGTRFVLSRQEFGIFARLRFRAFLYMVAVAIPWGRWPTKVPVRIVWVFGVLMFILGTIANEFGFLDWVQDVEKEEGIKLLDSDEEEDVADILASNTQATGTHQAARV
ncbi:hypothetical protein FRB91_000032 [Serendipita sp. 411]|nr:hypothetical protein FRC18_007819 [Serendipita sp. 400]KAG8861789.1 hypothetical protein FRB91_000032 [Serendipita sp. 411]